MSLEQKSQEAYDKTVLTLSGGALAISMTFLKDVAPLANAHAKSLLLSAWVSWAISMACSVSSFYVSGMALRRAICDVDDPCDSPRHRFLDQVTNVLNVLAGLLFVLGAFAICWFAGRNL